MFFCRGVMETVKKLGWKPDAIVCSGWMSSFLPLYIKDVFAHEPHFNEAKIIYSIFDDVENFKFSSRFIDKMKFDGFSPETIAQLQDGDLKSIRELAAKLSDGLVFCSNSDSSKSESYVNALDCRKIEFSTDETPMKVLSDFIDKLVEEEILSE